MENVIVDDRGMINDVSNKIFSVGVLKEKQEFAQQAKMRKHIIQSNNRQLEKKIRKQLPLFDKETYSCKDSEDDTIYVRSSLSKKNVNPRIRKNKNENKVKNCETSQFNIQTNKQDPLHNTSCNERRSEINETNSICGSLTNSHNYQLNSENVYYQGKEHIIEKTNTFSSQPYSSKSYWDRESSHDKLNERNACTNIGNCIVQGDMQTNAYYSVSKNHT